MGEGAGLGVPQAEDVGRADVVAEGEAAAARRYGALLDDDRLLFGVEKRASNNLTRIDVDGSGAGVYIPSRSNAVGVLVNAGDIGKFIAQPLRVILGHRIRTRRYTSKYFRSPDYQQQ